MGATLHGLRQDLAQAWRLLRRDSAFTCVALATLALGIGANTAMFSVVDAVVLKALPFRELDRLVVLDEFRQQHGSRTVSWMDFLDWRARNRVFDGMAAYRLTDVSLTGTGEATLLRAAEVSAPFFDLLGVEPLRGRSFSAVDDEAGAARTAVVSHDFWMTRLDGASDAIGRSIDLDGSSYSVVGILPPAFDFFGAPVDVYLPVGLHGGDPQWMRRGNHPDLLVLARLPRGVSLDTARAAFDIIMKELEHEYPTSNAGLRTSIVRLYDFRYGTTRTVLVALLAAVGCLLLIASANVANLLLARSAARRKEIAIRAALGAGRFQLVRQMLIESMVLSMVGGVLGVCLSAVVVPLVLAAAPLGAMGAGSFGIDGRVLGFTCAVSIGAGLFFGCAPALHAAGGRLVHGMNETGRSGGSSRRAQRTRSGLLIAETAVALVVLASAGLVLRSLANALRADPGFAPDHLLALDLTVPPGRYVVPARKALLFAQAVERLRGIPGVRAAGGGQCAPVSGSCPNSAFTLADRPVTSVVDMPTAVIDIVTPGYFEALRIPVVDGRVFSDADSPRSRLVAVVNQAFAVRQWPNGDAVGRQLREGGSQGGQPYRTIVGVVGSVKQGGLDTEAQPEVYLPVTQFPFAPWTMLQAMTLVLRTNGDPAGLTGSARRELHALDAALPVTGVRTMEAGLAESLARRTFATTLLTIFALLALAIAGVGVYGLMANDVNQRRQEIAVRMALGATPRRIRWLVLRRALSLGGAGVCVGLSVTPWITRSLSSLFIGVTPTDPATFGGVAALLLTTSLVATIAPLARATAIDPAAVVRDL